MTCQRCNVGDAPTNRCHVEKRPGVLVERELCASCQEVVGWTYPVTALDAPPAGQETPSAAPQAASAPAGVPKGRQPAAVHMATFGGGPFCGQAKPSKITHAVGEVTCRRCLARL